KIAHQAFFDELTDLPNRTLFRQRIDQAIGEATASGSSVAVLLLDLDRFKEINDTLGHRAGDDVLRAVGARLSSLDPEESRLARVGEVRRALDHEELVLHYQPKVSAATGRIVGVETLIRWQHPARGLLSPGEFIPFTERTGLIKPLSMYVLERATRQCSAWQ